MIRLFHTYLNGNTRDERGLRDYGSRIAPALARLIRPGPLVVLVYLATVRSTSNRLAPIKLGPFKFAAVM
jgi:hypothetical protein